MSPPPNLSLQRGECIERQQRRTQKSVRLTGGAEEGGNWDWGTGRVREVYEFKKRVQKVKHTGRDDGSPVEGTGEWHASHNFDVVIYWNEKY